MIIGSLLQIPNLSSLLPLLLTALQLSGRGEVPIISGPANNRPNIVQVLKELALEVNCDLVLQHLSEVDTDYLVECVLEIARRYRQLEENESRKRIEGLRKLQSLFKQNHSAYQTTGDAGGEYGAPNDSFRYQKEARLEARKPKWEHTGRGTGKNSGRTQGRYDASHNNGGPLFSPNIVSNRTAGQTFNGKPVTKNEKSTLVQILHLYNPSWITELSTPERETNISRGSFITFTTEVTTLRPNTLSIVVEGIPILW